MVGIVKQSTGAVGRTSKTLYVTRLHIPEAAMEGSRLTRGCRDFAIDKVGKNTTYVGIEPATARRRTRATAQTDGLWKLDNC